ncbi:MULTISPECIES: peroxiredoxin [unclassified Paenibacillus]|uniref:peroxiredoxin n=1 Tax=unclassified Paenibacillus TaxID=185978 RepID=UPI00278A2FC4|nr:MULTISPECIES: peroxiredoxin [unclassified Paenibacillus]MDQ0896842.1 peroxiredoxin (alkyl hydroperoxide reductase subunit C) [Paenibacillus sp. V4I7]MDQ0917012.1 peroxiredoxin (alkyl hydroperoxide reductase subunit C) [Paenibacillus sp. V4I5]
MTQLTVQPSPSFAKIGLPAPSFSLLSTKNMETLEEKITLEDYRGKWLVFFFWPFDFTFVCPTEITAFSDNYEQFLELDCEIVGASVDSVYTHRAWTQTPRDQSGIGPVKFPLVSDFSKETARAYGVLDDESGAAHRGLFIIDPEGVLRYQVVTDMNVGRSVDETLRVLQALQAGGLCPANWKPGDKTL